jgi:hypothetical protein
MNHAQDQAQNDLSPSTPSIAFASLCTFSLELGSRLSVYQYMVKLLQIGMTVGYAAYFPRSTCVAYRGKDCCQLSNMGQIVSLHQHIKMWAQTTSTMDTFTFGAAAETHEACLHLY